jgi:polyferredoxin
VFAVEKTLTKILAGRFAPNALRPLTLLIMVPLAAGLLFGPDTQSSFYNLMVWLVWWPMIIVLFLFAGRVWCGVCPFSLLGDWIQRATGLRRAVPDFLKEHGGWLTLIMFFWLIWMEEISNAPDSPRGTAIVILTIASGALFFSLFFRGHSWCRYMCPLGGISLAYARTSLFKIRSNESACAECDTKACVVVDSEYAGCPMHVTPFAINSVANCKLCGACVKRCSNDSLHVVFEVPSKDLSGQSQMAPVVPWFIILLAGMVSFLNATTSQCLPGVAAWLHSAANPVLIKTCLMAAALTAGILVFKVLLHFANDPANRVTPQHLMALATLPMIPLLLLTHLGYFIGRTLMNGGMLLTPVSDFARVRWLRLDFVWGTQWTGYVAPFLILLGLGLSLGVLRWITAQESGLSTGRIRRRFGLFYMGFAGWNLFTTWPVGAASENALADVTTASEIISWHPDGWTILWFFLGINAVPLMLAVIAKRSMEQSGTAETPAGFSASRSWNIRSMPEERQMEFYDWLLDQAMNARLRMPAVTALANACQEILSFLQLALPAGSAITVKALLRKNKGKLTIIHEGRPLALPHYKAVASIDDADEKSLDGIELRLASAYVEHMSYTARMSDLTCSFTLRQTC